MSFLLGKFFYRSYFSWDDLFSDREPYFLHTQKENRLRHHETCFVLYVTVYVTSWFHPIQFF